MFWGGTERQVYTQHKNAAEAKFESLQDALDTAIETKGEKSKVIVFPEAGNIIAEAR